MEKCQSNYPWINRGSIRDQSGINPGWVRNESRTNPGWIQIQCAINPGRGHPGFKLPPPQKVPTHILCSGSKSCKGPLKSKPINWAFLQLNIEQQKIPLLHAIAALANLAAFLLFKISYLKFVWTGTTKLSAILHPPRSWNAPGKAGYKQQYNLWMDKIWKTKQIFDKFSEQGPSFPVTYHRGKI